jgi:hypothetical protein
MNYFLFNYSFIYLFSILLFACILIYKINCYILINLFLIIKLLFTFKIFNIFFNYLSRIYYYIFLDVFNFLFQSILFIFFAKSKNTDLIVKEVQLTGGQFLVYGYQDNDKVKFRMSFNNKYGERPLSHKRADSNLTIGFVIYSSKSNLKILNRLITLRFSIKGNRKYLNCSINQLEQFILNTCKTME